ncbi:MAG: tetratricopeptide repeat protein [Planctomycetaceae bacterium]|nr:tetratricopeptide repeat protein [Planctomycetaceae bacterium]
MFRTNVADPGRQVLDSHDQPVGPPPALKILCPFDGSVFPPEIAPPRFHWEDGTPRVDRWTVTIDFADDGMPMRFFCDSRQWAPASDVWQQIKNRSLSGATVTVGGVNRLWPEDVLSSDRVSISTSTNEVGAPIFYREVNLPFLDAVKDPAAHIRWRFGSISSSEQPPVVLEKMPLCGNCHSFSQDGGLIGMDVDYGSDKGSYVICPVSEDMVYDNAKIITWSDYAREDNRGTLGLLSQVSPDGRYVISTVKDRSIFAAVDSLEFSQLFFPIQGILAYYDRQTKEFHALHGADDGRYVQSNAAWSPDGKYLVFARSEAFFSDAFREKHGGLTKPEDVSEFLLARKSFQFELRRIPFNDGKGGESEPLRGASNNGMSNYFPKYSPDGKWIVFCQARSYMLLQADSALYIVPAEGGEARRLECNTSRMNSWHSWSPNGRWLVFSSKAYSPYTQLFLAHIDEEGRASPPVVLSHFTSEDRAANIPEFVNASPDAIRSIRAEFIDDLSYLQAGKVNVNEGQHAEAIHNFQKALEINPENIEARLGLGGELLGQDRLDEAQHHFDETLARDPTNQDARCFLGAIRESRGDLPEAMKIYRQVLQAKPEHAMTHLAIGRLSLKTGETEEGRHHLLEAARLMPGNASPYLDLAASYAGQQNADQAIAMYRLALARSPDSDAALVGLALALLEVRRPRDIDEAMGLATKACQVTQQASPLALMVLAEAQAAAGRSSEAVATVRKAMDLAERTGRADLVEAGRTLLEQYQQP